MYRMFATQQSDCYYIGLKLSEAYVTRAEAYARTGEKDLAIADLNRLLVTRIKKEDYVALIMLISRMRLLCKEYWKNVGLSWRLTVECVGLI
ncbi:MAG: hypothetical protein ACLUDU_00415 [Butyricimonas faecihominis]